MKTPIRITVVTLFLAAASHLMAQPAFLAGTLVWQAAPPMLHARTGASATFLTMGASQRVYVFGGSVQAGAVTATEYLNISAGSWNNVPTASATLIGCSALPTSISDALIFNANGVQSFSASTGLLVAKPSLQADRNQPAVGFTPSTGKVLVIGGTDAGGSPVNSLEAYVPNSGSSALSPVCPLNFVSGVRVGNAIYLVGVDSSGGNSIATYNILTQTFIHVFPIGVEQNFQVKLGAIGSTLIIVSESGNTYEVHAASQTQPVTPLGSLPGGARNGFALASTPNSLYVIGGYRRFGGDLKVCDRLVSVSRRYIPVGKQTALPKPTIRH